MNDNIMRLEGTELDGYVLAALGLRTIGDGSVYFGVLGQAALAIAGDPDISPFVRSPSREWEVGGPLIEQNHITLCFDKGLWRATCQKTQASGPTPLVAAMRALCLAAQDLPDLEPEDLTPATMAELLRSIGRVLRKKEPSVSS